MKPTRLQRLREENLLRSKNDIMAAGPPHTLLVAHLQHVEVPEYWAVMNSSYDLATLDADGVDECVLTNAFLIQDLIDKDIRDEELRNQFGCPVKHSWIGVDY